MLRSLFSGISGLRANQTALDVTGNNIANANTIGYKSQRITFQETLSQTVRDAAGPQPDRGGANPSQIGLGVQVSSIQTNMGQGSAQLTNVPTDVMIQGDGMFVVRRGAEQYYTRVGAFNFDPDGRLVMANGAIVQGYLCDPIDGTPDIAGGLIDLVVDENFADPPIPAGVQMTSYGIAQDGRIVGNLSDGTEVVFGRIAMADFANPQGLEKSGETLFQGTANSGEADITVPGDGARGNLLVGALEMSNVDLAAEFTNLIIAQRGFQAASRVITTSDQVLEELVNIKR